MSLVKDILAYSKVIENDRTELSVLQHMVSEVQELYTEVAVDAGILPPEDGDVDGIIGESIDIILCAVDLIYKHKPDITEEELRLIASKKLEKWKRLYSK